MLAVFSLILGAYATYAGIVGKGYAYKNDYPEEVKGPANALLRKFLLIIGPILVLCTIVELFSLFGEISQMFSMIGCGVAVVCIIIYIVIFRVRFGKKV